MAFMEHGQFPLWNAHYCGGTPLLANPQSAFLTPFFLTVLLFGTVAGLKIQAAVYLFLGLLGTFLAAKKLGAVPVAAATAAVIFMLSSWYAQRVLVGHTTFLPFALLPLAFLLYLKALEQWKWIGMAALVTALIFLAGGIYPFYATILLLCAYALLTSIETRKLQPLLLVAAILALTFLISAVKLLPVLEFTSGVPSENDVQLNSLGMTVRGLLNPAQGIEKNDVLTGRAAFPDGMEKEVATLEGRVAWQWHEYSSYIGILSLLIAAISVINYRRNWKLLLLAAFFLILALGNSSLLPLWEMLRNLPFFNSLHGPSRFLIPFTFIAALLAAKALSTNHNKALLTILAIITLEHLVIFIPLLSSAFPIVPPSDPDLQTENEQFIQFYTSAPYVSQYPNLLQNLGTVNCYERIHIATKALPQFVDGEPYPEFKGNAYIAETGEQLDYSYFSPNKVNVIVTDAQINDTATLVVNQNYYKGWEASNGKGKAKAKSYNGLLATEISKEDKEVEFKFMPRSFLLGAAITAAAIILSLLLFFKPELIRKLILQESSHKQDTP